MASGDGHAARWQQPKRRDGLITSSPLATAQSNGLGQLTAQKRILANMRGAQAPQSATFTTAPRASIKCSLAG